MGRGLGALGLGEPASANGFKLEQPSTKAIVADDLVASSQGADKPENGKQARETGLIIVPLTAIAPNPYQPRKHIDPDVLAELAQSIRENGLIQPPVVSYNPDFEPDYQAQDQEESNPDKKERRARYLLIAGERRWQASKLAGVTSIAVVLKEASPVQMLELALVENIQRADLNPLEEAQAYRQLIQEFKLTQEAVARKVGKSRAAIANSLRLFDLPEPILESLYQNKISEGHARGLLMVHKVEDQYRLLHDIISKQFSVRQTEEAARRMNALAATAGYLPEVVQAHASPAERETRVLEEQFKGALGARVSLTRSNKGGKLVIQFYSDEELDGLYHKIVGSDI